jgi:hypothetical protein
MDRKGVGGMSNRYAISDLRFPNPRIFTFLEGMGAAEGGLDRWLLGWLAGWLGFWWGGARYS